MMRFVNDIPLFKKIFAIFVMFIFIPLIILSIQFMTKMDFYIKDKIQSQLINSTETTISSFKKAIDLTINLAYTIYSDSRVIEAINHYYSDIEEFNDSYEKNIKPILQNARILYPQISRITIYCDNPTILNSDGLAILTDEYKKMFEPISKEGKTLFVLSGLENEKPFVSIVLNLNFYEQYVPKYQYEGIKKYLRIDLNRVYFNNLFNLFGDGHVYVMDKNGKVFFGDTLFYDEIANFNDILKENTTQKVVVDKQLSTEVPYFEGWRLVVTANYNELNRQLFKHQLYYISMVILCFVLTFFALFIITNSVVSRLYLLNKYLKKAKNQNFEIIDIAGGKDEIGQVIDQFNNMARRIKELIEKEVKYELRQKELAIQKKQAEINALQSQINPHFLFNTLETIRMRSILKKELETANAIKLLAKLLKRSIKWNKDLITIEEELSAVKDYLEIQRYRFGEKLSYHIEAEEDILNAKIPKMTIQPIVENACVHGIENSKENGLVIVRITKEDGYIIIEGMDNGVGVEDSKLSQILNSIKHGDDVASGNVGLKNVYKRLELFFEDNFWFEIYNNQTGGLTVKIKIPLMRD